MISRTEQSYNSIEQMKEQPEWDACIKAMKEACKQVLELAAENAKAEIHTEWEGNTGSEYYTDYAVVNKQSIIDTINQVE